MFAYVLTASLAVLALGTGLQVESPEAAVPTTIERALIERACGATDTPWADSDAQRCFAERLGSLRADFGHDLDRLSSSERKKIDAACSQLLRPEQRDAHVDCLAEQLVAVHTRRQPQDSAAPGTATVAPSAAPEAPAAPAPSAAGASSAQPASTWRRAALVGGAIAIVLAAGVVGFRSRRPRRVVRTCRVCGVDVPGADLCAVCRHETADALKRAAAKRMQDERAQGEAQEEEARRQREHEAEQREISAREEEDRVHRLSAVAVPIAPAFEEGPAEILQTPTRAKEPIGAPVDERTDDHSMEFDPYAVLGIARDAGPDDIRAGYEQAMKRYDPELVSFLGDAAQAHFKTKAEAVERAYQMLSATQVLASTQAAGLEPPSAPRAPWHP